MKRMLGVIITVVLLFSLCSCENEDVGKHNEPRIESSAKEKRVGAFQFSYVTLDGDNVQITKIVPAQETIPDKLIIPDKIDGKSVVKLGDPLA